jgi:hypothetical protein
MAKDDRDILEILKEELDFLQKGGYRRSFTAPWQTKSIFQDSLTCSNYGYPYRAYPCSECHLLDFVSPEHQREWIPCHFIPLNERAETIDSLELEGNEEKLERTVKHWILSSIDRIEEERSQVAMAGCP